LFKYLSIFILVVTIIDANDNIYIKTKDLKLIDLVNIVSKTIKKTIVLPLKFSGDINIVQNISVKKSDLIDILKISLSQNNYELIKYNNIFKIVKISKEKVKDKNRPKDIKIITKIIHLQNAKASSIKKVLSPIINKYSKKQTKQKLFISSDDESNSVILMGPKNYVAEIKKLVLQLDDYRAQIYVTAKIIEVNEAKTSDIGIRYGLDGGENTNHGLFSFAFALGGKAVPIDTSSMGLTIPSIRRGINLGASINLLSMNSALNIISEPSLLCINNKKSSIYIGQTKSLKINSAVNTTGIITNQSYQREDIGLRLTIIPRISNKNKVLLEIETTIEDVRNTITNGQPDTSKKQINTTAIVDTGESVIIGGLTKSISEDTNNDVPGLSNIPLISGLFKNKITLKEKINLVIIVTPYVIPKSKNITYIREQLTQLKMLEDKYTKDIKKILIQKKDNINEKEDQLYEDEEEDDDF
jgi:general secretion pathway protein D